MTYRTERDEDAYTRNILQRNVHNGTLIGSDIHLLKLLDVLQNLLAHALTLQTMYQEDLEPKECDRLRAKNDAVAKKNCAPLRYSVGTTGSFAAAMKEFSRIDPKHREG